MRGAPSRKQISGSALLILSLLCLPATAGDWGTAMPFDPEAADAPSRRMHLGHRAERWSGADAQAPRRKPRDTCGRWRALATQLGETYAGHALRQTVVKRVCTDLGGERAEEAWGWPWEGLAAGQLLPPRPHRAIGAWQIRCGAGGWRRRCALVTVLPLPPGATVDPGDPAIVSHFVIDMVGGRESLLWRLFVPTDPVAKAAVAGPTWVAAAPSSRDNARAVRYSLDRGEQAERFAACAPSGCMMEASPARAGQVATRLWDARPIEIEVTLSSGRTVGLTLPAKGFRAALAELIRLRREETRPTRR